ncbi:cupin domain-containing protein [Amycolatopsis granulosa]|uniref:cupin domain-containing protein n=1 Tax=Amycolatopsis granulosa TaxID=185684 RepID=UPI00142171EB|nr:cupin domain-containing protein [Amycolatopsis granulosa]NIH85225.1 mannose-6-phosphate isomerase-like protein (cupin superfamily) [Amycolatopsis granulosa]
MPVAALAEAPRFERAGAVFRPLAVPSRGAVQLAVWSLELAAGVTGEEHSVSREEVFVLHSGALEVVLGGETHRLTPGDAMIVPPDTLFRLDNPGAEPACAIVCTSAGMVGRVGGTTVVPPWAS